MTRRLQLVGGGTVIEVTCDRCQHWGTPGAGAFGGLDAKCALLPTMTASDFGCAHFAPAPPPGTEIPEHPEAYR